MDNLKEQIAQMKTKLMEMEKEIDRKAGVDDSNVFGKVNNFVSPNNINAYEDASLIVSHTTHAGMQFNNIEKNKCTVYLDAFNRLNMVTSESNNPSYKILDGRDTISYRNFKNGDIAVYSTEHTNSVQVAECRKVGDLYYAIVCVNTIKNFETNVNYKIFRIPLEDMLLLSIFSKSSMNVSYDNDDEYLNIYVQNPIENEVPAGSLLVTVMWFIR